MADLWEDNSIQFPRLISEIVATQDLDLDALAESMDLEVEQIKELMNRAQEEFETIKNNL
jgi:hypothetical protein